jgi:hypothetical protein
MQIALREIPHLVVMQGVTFFETVLKRTVSHILAKVTKKRIALQRVAAQEYSEADRKT